MSDDQEREHPTEDPKDDAALADDAADTAVADGSGAAVADDTADTADAADADAADAADQPDAASSADAADQPDATDAADADEAKAEPSDQPDEAKAEPSDQPDAADQPDTAEPDPTVDEADLREQARHPAARWPAMLVGTPRWLVAVRLLLAPLLAGGAVGLHWWLNVPEHIIESPRDQGAKKKKKKKARRKPKARTPNKDKKAAKDRTPEKLEEDWTRYESEPFDDEPVLAVWARRHQALINRAVVVARRQAFEGAPEQPRVVLNGTKCKTVRCRFKLRSKYPHALDAVGNSLSRLQSEGEDVWRTFDLSPAPTPEGDEEHYVEVVVTFRTDETDSRSLSIRPSPLQDDPPAEPPAGTAPAEPAAGTAPTERSGT